MRKIILPIMLLILTGFGGCDAVVPKTSQQIVYDAHAVYAALLVVEIKYDRLPRCTLPVAPQACSDTYTALKVKSISDATKASLDSAQRTVRTPGFGDSAISSAVTAAKNAIEDYRKIVEPLKGQVL